MTATATVLLEILEAIEQVDVDNLAKIRFRQMISAISEVHGIDCVSRANRAAFTLQLLETGVSRSNIRDRLVTKYGISRAHSYRILHQALQDRTAPKTVS